MKRSPLDPQPGMVLAYKDWTITVTARTPTEVVYAATRGASSREGRQGLAEWQAWAGSARERGHECVVFDCGIAGPCTVCKKPLVESDVHVSEVGAVHLECCPAKLHRGRKRKAKEIAA